MKALTLSQPYASLVAIGAKRIETRSWQTSYRGPLAIHAGKGFGLPGGKKAFAALANTEPFYRALRAANLPNYDLHREGYPFGAVIATCSLLDCVAISEIRTTGMVGLRTFIIPPYTDLPEYAFGDYTVGRYAWLLGNIRALPEPSPARGALSLWEWEGQPQ